LPTTTSSNRFKTPFIIGCNTTWRNYDPALRGCDE
jgi:hypothetical protein